MAKSNVIAMSSRLPNQARVQAKLHEIYQELDAARSMVFVCASALGEGETNLETLSSNVLSGAADKLTSILDEVRLLNSALDEKAGG
jgi:hypothetical protein